MLSKSLNELKITSIFTWCRNGFLLNGVILVDRVYQLYLLSLQVGLSLPIVNSVRLTTFNTILTQIYSDILTISLTIQE